MKKIHLSLWVCFFMLLFITSPLYARIYNIGPGQEFETPDNVPWLSLTAGDEVNFHYRYEPYAYKIGLHGQGTAEEPIIIRGIPDPSGNLPTLTGINALTPSTITNFFNTTWDEMLGTIIIKRASSDPWGYKPKFIEIRDLKITGGHSNYTYTAQDGTTGQSYSHGAAGIWAVLVENFTVSGCEITDNGNGLFVLSKASEEEVSRNIMVEGNYFHNNGNVGRDREHNLYLQASNVVYQNNRISPLRNGAAGSSLKDRSSGTVVRYNWIESSARTLDLIDAEDSYVILAAEPQYHDVFVYGNLLINDAKNNSGSASMIHYGGDTGNQSIYKNGTLHFYHNTVYVRADQSDYWRIRLFQLEVASARVDLWNNIIIRDGNTNFSIMHTYGDAYFLGNNWVSSGYLDGPDNGTYTGTIYNTETVTTGNNVGLTDQVNYNFIPTESSAALGQAIALPTPITEKNLLEYQYDVHQKRVLRGGQDDLGAFEDGTSIASCSADHLEFCLTETSCTNTNGNWCDGTCQQAECGTSNVPTIEIISVTIE